MKRVLREDQQLAIDDMRSAIAEGERRIMVKAPTGWGKTVAAGSIIERALQRKKRVLFTVPALSLVDQAVESFRLEGIDQIGVIQGYHEMTDWTQPVQVASVQTLMRRKIPEADVVLVDEAHKWFKFYADWFLDQAWLNIPIIGLSATPWTKGLGAYYRRLLIANTIERLIASGDLSPFRVFAPSHPDLKGVRTVAGDYHEGQLSDVMQAGSLTADIVQTWLRLAQRRPTFCFCVDRAHAKRVQEQFEAAGVRAAYVDAYTKREEREVIRRRFHAGEIDVVCNVGVLTTGIDWDVRCLILARPTKSESLLVQIVGRGLRTADGKDDCLILDHSDNHLRLGFVTDIDAAHTTLDDGRPKERFKSDSIALPKECPQCSFLKPPKSAVCPNCGFTAKAVSKIEPEEGELRELRSEKKKRPGDRFPDKEATFGMLKWVCAERRRKEGWAAYKFKELYGVWPSAMGLKDTEPCKPSEELLSWLKSQEIRWARSKRNPGNAGAAYAA